MENKDTDTVAASNFIREASAEVIAHLSHSSHISSIINSNLNRKSDRFAAGLTVDAIKYILGGKFRASFRPLNDAIIQNRILGVAGIIGCNNSNKKNDIFINTLIEHLIMNNVLVLQTGCTAELAHDAALEMAGKGLREVCEAAGIPPILYMGSCADSTRIIEAAIEVLKEGGLGDALGKLPVVGAAAELASDTDFAIACTFVANGIDFFLGNPINISNSEKENNYFCSGAAEDFNACFHCIDDPLKAAQCIIQNINASRDALGINKKQERKLFDMKDRREL